MENRSSAYYSNALALKAKLCTLATARARTHASDCPKMDRMGPPQAGNYGFYETSLVSPSLIAKSLWCDFSAAISLDIDYPFSTVILLLCHESV